MEYGGWIGRYLGFGEGGIFEIRGAIEAIADGFVERLKINTPWLRRKKSAKESKKRRTNSEEMIERVTSKYNIASELVRVEERKIIWVLVSAW